MFTTEVPFSLSLSTPRPAAWPPPGAASFPVWCFVWGRSDDWGRERRKGKRGEREEEAVLFLASSGRKVRRGARGTCRRGEWDRAESPVSRSATLRVAGAVLAREKKSLHRRRELGGEKRKENGRPRFFFFFFFVGPLRLHQRRRVFFFLSLSLPRSPSPSSYLFFFHPRSTFSLTMSKLSRAAMLPLLAGVALLCAATSAQVRVFCFFFLGTLIFRHRRRPRRKARRSFPPLFAAAVVIAALPSCLLCRAKR